MKDSSVYQIITDRIIDLLEQGTIPWQKPWRAGEHAPQNLLSRKAYRGVNVFLLNSMHYASPFWISYKQAVELGGHVKRGERATPVVFWKWLESEDKATGNPQRIPLLRYYSVFNVAQCEDIPADKIPALSESRREHDPITEAERIVNDMPQKPEIQLGGNRACYIPSLDRVCMPQPEHFRSNEDYYSTLFHELSHATGSEKRLNRKGVSGSDGEWSSHGSAPYAREELIAECGAAFLCGESGIVERTIENSVAYVASWLQRLKNDPKLVVQAAASAQKAADYVLGKWQTETTEEN